MVNVQWLLTPSFNDDRVAVAEAVVWVVPGLEALQPLDASALMAVMLLEGLKAGGVVDVGIDRAVRLAGVPLVAGLGGPGQGRLLAVRVRRDRIEEHQMAVSAEGAGRGCGIQGLDRLCRITLAHDACPRCEICVLSYALLEAFVDEALSRQIVDL